MITESQYKKALSVIDQYKKEQEELINAKRIKVADFVKTLNPHKGNNNETRLYYIFENCKDEYLDFFYDYKNFKRLRNAGYKTWLLFAEMCKIEKSITEAEFHRV